MKTAFVFPGQGAQYVGMAMDYLAANEEHSRFLDEFDAQHGTQLRQIMEQGPEDELKQTRITQPAILFHSICALKSFQAKSEIRPDFVAGHSLGEFTALVATGILSWIDAMHIVHKRGEFMIKANTDTPFAMAASIGLPAEEVIAACQDAESAGLVRAVNFNTPIQTVISGTKEGVARASEILKERGAKRVLPLVVGGPFHTPLINDASLWLAEEMEKVNWNDASIPVVSNVDALPYTQGSVAKAKLTQQIISPVQWVKSIRYMLDAGVKRFIEFGPQKVLSGMVKNIDKEAQIFNLDKLCDLDALLSEIEQ
jgi:[acyl-carrier-protein] S-malonyltransferase